MAGIAQLVERQVVVLDVHGFESRCSPQALRGSRWRHSGRLARMDIDLPDTIPPETIQQAAAAAAMVRAWMAGGSLPPGLTAEALGALLTVVDAVVEAASGDNTDLSPSDAAERLRMARPTVMRLIARGELSSRKDGGHYLLSPRELRSFQTRLASNRREALGGLAAMAEEFGF